MRTYCITQLGLTFLLALGTAEAQSTTPGAPDIDPSRIRFGAMEYAVTLVRGDEEQVVGTLRDEIIPLRGNDPVLRRVQTLVRASTITIDSTYSDPETLAPRWHKSVQPQFEVEYEFAGTRLNGEVRSQGATVRTMDTTLAEPAFDVVNWDLAVRALPLAEGETALLAVYDVEHGVRRFNMRVVGREPRGRTDVIHVLMDMGQGREVHAWFDEETRVLLRLESQVAPDVLLRHVLKATR